MAVYAKSASAAVRRHMPAVRAIAAHHDAATGFANCNLNAQGIPATPALPISLPVLCMQLQRALCTAHAGSAAFIHRANPVGCISLHVHIAL